MKATLLLFLLLCNTTVFTYSAHTDPGKRFMGEWIFVKATCTEVLGDNLYQERSTGFLETTKITFTVDRIATVTSKDGKTIATFPFILSNGRDITLDYVGDNETLKRFNGKFEMRFSRKKGKTLAELIRADGCSILLER